MIDESKVTDPLPVPPKKQSFLTEFELASEGGDRGFETSGGNRLRVKVQRSHHESVKVAPAVNGAVAETSFTLLITVSEMTEDNQVKKRDGKLLIHDAHEILVTGEQLGNPDWSLDAVVMDVIEKEAHRIEQVIASSSAVADSLKSWGAE